MEHISPIPLELGASKEDADFVSGAGARKKRKRWGSNALKVEGLEGEAAAEPEAQPEAEAELVEIKFMVHINDTSRAMQRYMTTSEGCWPKLIEGYQTQYLVDLAWEPKIASANDSLDVVLTKVDQTLDEADATALTQAITTTQLAASKLRNKGAIELKEKVELVITRLAQPLIQTASNPDDSSKWLQQAEAISTLAVQAEVTSVATDLQNAITDVKTSNNSCALQSILQDTSLTFQDADRCHLLVQMLQQKAGALALSKQQPRLVQLQGLVMVGLSSRVVEAQEHGTILPLDFGEEWKDALLELSTAMTGSSTKWKKSAVGYHLLALVRSLICMHNSLQPFESTLAHSGAMK